MTQTAKRVQPAGQAQVGERAGERATMAAKSQGGTVEGCTRAASVAGAAEVSGAARGSVAASVAGAAVRARVGSRLGEVATVVAGVVPALKVTGLSKTFAPGTAMEKKALSDIDLTLAPGEFGCIIGSNGAGKSTLFNAISGEFLPDEGSVELSGDDITFLPDYRRARRISRVFQDPMRGTAPGLTVAENVVLAYMRSRHGGLGLAMTKKTRAFVREQLASLGFGLEDRMDTKVGMLSGGQRQAVSLLMCTIGNPDLLLLDEHTAALDPVAAQRIMELTEQVVRERGVATLMITHNMSQALNVGDRTIVMDSGRIVADISQERRAGMTLDGLLELYRSHVGTELDSDEMLLTK